MPRFIRLALRSPINAPRRGMRRINKLRDLSQFISFSFAGDNGRLGRDAMAPLALIIFSMAPMPPLISHAGLHAKLLRWDSNTPRMWLALTMISPPPARILRAAAAAG